DPRGRGRPCPHVSDSGQMGSPGRADGPLPQNFAAQLAALLAPGQAEGAAAVIAEAARLDDERLGAFLEAFAERLTSSSLPVTTAELDRLLAQARGAGPQPRSAVPSSSSRPRVPWSPTVVPRGADSAPRRPRGPGSRTNDREAGR